jgi:VIT1/CCC1 family predicted Fe2+/Mn2+ transporter
MRHSLKTGFSFGMTSGVITTLGLMVGLHSGTHSRLAVIGGILTIAVADSFSDALGIHIAEEAEHVHTVRQVWASTIATFVSKLAFALTFAVPILFLDLTRAVWVSVGWGLIVLAMVSYRIARAQARSRWKVICEHLIIALAVIAITHLVGDWIAATFG